MLSYKATTTTHIYTLSLHDALPIFNRRSLLLALRLLWKTPIFPSNSRFPRLCAKCLLKLKRLVSIWRIISETCCCLERRSEERFSRNAETDLVCRLLLEKKNRRTRA